MSVLKRLGNVARGKMLEIGRTLGEGGPPDDELDPDLPPTQRGAATKGGAADPGPLDADSARALLHRLHQDGLLTDDELERKLAALEAPPPPPTPRPRRL